MYPLLDLPELVLIVILGELPARDVLHTSSTCKDLFSLCQHNAVWKRVSKRRWSLKPSLGISRNVRWKQYYAQKLAMLRDGAFKWHSFKPNGECPSKRYQHTGSVVGNNVYFIGGQELPEKRFNDIYVYQTESKAVEKVAPASGTPPKFARHSAVSIAHKIYLFGGFDGISQHFHLSVYNTVDNTWETPEVVGYCPPSRTNHAAASIGSIMYMFGGMYKESGAGCMDKLVFLNDMYMLDTAVSPMRWTKIAQQGDVPAPRCGHRLIAIGSRLLLFGGGCGEQWDVKYSDIHIFDPSTNTWNKPKVHGQAPVCTFTIAFASGVFFFLFGGQSIYDNNLTNDLYVLDTVHMSWTKLQAHNQYPSARDMASGNVVGNTMHMFGGYCGSAIDSFYTLQMDPSLDVNPCSLPPNA